MKYLLIILIFIAALGCNQLKKTQRYLFEHPEFSSEYCAEQFPNKDSVTIRYDTVLDIISWVDTVFVKETAVGDTIYKTKVVYKTVYQTKTLTRDSIIYRSNTAEFERLRLVLQSCQNVNNEMAKINTEQSHEIDKWKSTAKTRFWWILLLIGGGIVYTGMKLKKFLT